MEKQDDKVIIISLSLDQDVESILNYFCNKLKNPYISEKFLAKLNKQFELVALFPHMHCVKFGNDIQKIRIAFVMQYCLCYIINVTSHCVEIVRIFHMRENYEEKIWL